MGASAVMKPRILHEILKRRVIHSDGGLKEEQ